MSGFKVVGLDKFIKDVDKLADNVKTETQLVLNDFAERVVQDAKQLVASNSSNEGRLLNSISYSNGDLNVSIVAAVIYAPFIEFGTRKFASQYLSSLPQDWQTYAATFKGQSGPGTFDDFFRAIMAWVKRKGIDDKAAYPIARSILINGIRPKPFLYPSINKNLPLLLSDLKSIFN